MTATRSRASAPPDKSLVVDDGWTEAASASIIRGGMRAGLRVVDDVEAIAESRHEPFIRAFRTEALLQAFDGKHTTSQPRTRAARETQKAVSIALRTCSSPEAPTRTVILCEQSVMLSLHSCWTCEECSPS